MRRSRVSAFVLAATLGACGGESSPEHVPSAPSAPRALAEVTLAEVDGAWVLPAPIDATTVAVGAERISIGDDAIVTLVGRRVSAAERLGGEHGLMIPRLRAALAPVRGGTLAFAFDAGTPFQTLAELVYTGMQSEPRAIVFLVRHRGAIASFPIEMPRLRDAREPASIEAQIPSLGLYVSASGATVRQGGLEPDCEEVVGDSPLAECLTRVARSRADDRTVLVFAAPEVTFRDVARAIATSRGSERAPLFPETMLAVAP